TFEGVIPKGNYGAGSVVVWDQGTYEAAGAHSPDDSVALLRDGLARGRLSMVLHGQKLRGQFALVRLQRGKANEWLLLKKRDEFASLHDVTADERSVASGRTLAEVAHQLPANGKRRPAQKATTGKGKRRSATMPRDIRPMLATLVDEPFDRPGWIFEPKWDGYRAIAEVSGEGVRLYSRNHKTFEQRFAPVVEALRDLGHEAILDGEVVVVDPAGRAHFQLLQNHQKTGKGQLVYYVFDLLFLDGKDLRGLPLVRRKELLADMLPDLPHVRL